jgi:hypothetical protein
MQLEQLVAATPEAKRIKLHSTAEFLSQKSSSVNVGTKGRSMAGRFGIKASVAWRLE